MEQFPSEIVDALKAISSKARLRIIAALAEEEFTFSKLQDHLHIEKAALNFHLKKLTAAAIVEHFYMHILGDDRYSYYGLTGFGKRLINAVVGSLVPLPPITVEYEPLVADTWNFLTEIKGEGGGEQQALGMTASAPEYLNKALTWYVLARASSRKAPVKTKSPL